MNIESLVRKNILRLKPYSSARDEFKGQASVYLDANENPFSNTFNRYPDPHQIALKKRISELKNVPVANIFVGNGSDEPIDLLIRAFCEPGVDEIIIPQPTYGMYQVSADINNIGVRSVRLTDDFDLDVKTIQQQYAKNTKLLFLCSPNNPSGNLLSADKVDELITSFPGLVVVDEAYIDFTSSPSFSQKLSRYPNLVVLQTLSKAWGLASLRVGLCFAYESVLEILNKIKPPYNLSGLTQLTALEFLAQPTVMENQVKEILVERANLMDSLKDVRVVEKIYPSDANFVLVKVTDASGIYTRLMNQGIIVRDRSKVILCDGCLRVTIGTREENQTLMEALKKI